MTTTYSSDSAIEYIKKQIGYGTSRFIRGHYTDTKTLINDFNKLLSGEICSMRIYDSERDKVPHHCLAGTIRQVYLKHRIYNGISPNKKSLVFDIEWDEWRQYIFDYKTTLNLENARDIVEIYNKFLELCG